jgi:hypothetical protein
VLGEDNRPIQEPELLRSYLAVALNNAAQGEETFTPEQKGKIYELTTKLYKKKEVDLTLDDRSFLKERVGKVYGPLICGRISATSSRRKSRSCRKRPMRSRCVRHPKARPARVQPRMAASNDELARRSLAQPGTPDERVMRCLEAIRRALEEHDCELQVSIHYNGIGQRRRRSG